MSILDPNITQPALDTKKPVGNGITAPAYFNGVANIIATKSASTNQGTDINGTASSENLSAKFKNPNVSQDVPEAGRGQYM
jgi:hypothetical protein